MKSFKTLFFALMSAAFLLVSCDKEDPKPEITLNETAITAVTGESVTITATFTNTEYLSKVIVTKKLDGTAVAGEEQTFETPGETVSITTVISEDDVDSILTFTFEAYNNDNEITDTKDVVITIQLSNLAILLKYDWRQYSQVTTATGDEILSEDRMDDLYRLHNDNFYDVDYGAVNNPWDGLAQFCAWKLDDSDADHIMFTWSYFGFLATDATIEEFEVLQLDENELWINKNYDLSAFGLSTEENVTVKFIATPKAEDFVPYRGVNPAEWAVCTPIE